MSGAVGMRIRRARLLESQIAEHKRQIAKLRKELAAERRQFGNRRGDSLVTRLIELIEQSPGIRTAELAERTGARITSTRELLSRCAKGLVESRRLGGWERGWFPLRAA